MELSEILVMFRADSIWGVALRGVIWLIAVMIFAIGLDKGKQADKIKADVGWFFGFLFGIIIISWRVFGAPLTF